MFARIDRRREDVAVLMCDSPGGELGSTLGGREAVRWIDADSQDSLERMLRGSRA